MISLLLAATIAQATLAPLTAPSPSAAPSTFAPTPAPTYTARPCVVLINRAHLAGKTIDADNLGRLLAQALKDHGLRPGSVVQTSTVRMALVDFIACFQTPGETK